VSNFVEKPKLGTAPSNLAIIGMYIFTPEIFMFLEKQEIGAGREIQLSEDLLKFMAKIVKKNIANEKFIIDQINLIYGKS